MSQTQTSYTLGGAGAAAMPHISIGDPYYSSTKTFSNRMMTLNIHEAHGGYIVEIITNPAAVGELYIVSGDQDLGIEIGKIITHNTLSNKHE